MKEIFRAENVLLLKNKNFQNLNKSFFLKNPSKARYAATIISSNFSRLNFLKLHNSLKIPPHLRELQFRN